MMQEVIGGLIVALLAYLARQVHVGQLTMRGMRRDIRRQWRNTQHRFAHYNLRHNELSDRVENCEDRLDELDDRFAERQPEEDYGQEGHSGEAANP